MRVFLLAVVSYCLGLALLQPVARWVAPLGLLLPGRPAQAFTTSFLLDLPVVLVSGPGGWAMSRFVPKMPGRLAMIFVASLFALDAATALLIMGNLGRFADVWALVGRVPAAALSFALARKAARS